ncbi:MAG TPA: UDP-N-acetylglucosamine 1-carboxyvinyltransferase [Firmicutes bacterium]|nr:UDP-N-acetylglucosamine 1-carboxyvinyltransferase [Caldisericia bacterium]HDJ99995.1 UDP-N-acetylglucosamine 1-carboxyvinyltransferase [Bacillota bacterium]
MEIYRIEGGNRLKGEVIAQGSKNGALPLISASLLTDEPVYIRNVPRLLDVGTLIEVIRGIGVKAKHLKDGTVSIEAGNLNWEITDEKASRIRGSITLVGSLLSRIGKVRLPFPGGCHIGSRPIDLHIKGFKALGADVRALGTLIEGEAKKMRGAKIYLDYPSVGATENILLASVFAKGETVIENAAQEPEVVELANFLNSMGGKIEGAGTKCIRVEGVKKLHGTDFTLSPDRVEIGTFMIGAAITGGDITIKPVIFEHIIPLVFKLREIGVNIKIENGKILRVIAKKRPKKFEIRTMPFPGFPTDLQSQMLALATIAEGVSLITETVFENRFMVVPELRKMGAKIRVEGRTAFVEGVTKLIGTEVTATDLRAGAALVLAGLRAEGETIIKKIYHIERGYYNLHEKIRQLGGKIWKETINF